MDRSMADHRELVEALAGTSAKRFRDLIASHVHNAAAHLRGTAR
jgi:DNA-binding GntR family transcriptional regulator